MQVISFGFFISVPLFLEKIEGMNPPESGMFFSVMTLTTAIISLLVGLFYKNSRTWLAIIFGFLILILASVGWLIFLLYSFNSFLVLSFILFGISFGVLYPQVNIEFMESLEEVKDRNMSSGLFYTSSLFFSVIGVCITTAILGSSSVLSKEAYRHLLVVWIVLAIFGIIFRSIRKTNSKNLSCNIN